MARLAATAVLLLCLLAVASCRVIEVEPDTVFAISDEQSQADPAVPRETDAAETISSLLTVTVAPEAILRLPSNRRPYLHGFLRWTRNHDLTHYRSTFARPGDARVLPAVLPEEATEAEVEVDAVAEPDPDSHPDTDCEQKPFHGDKDENEPVKAWKGEMLRRFRGHGLRFHHHHHHHHEHAVEKDDGDVGEHPEQQDKEEGAGDMQQLQHVKLFSRHFPHHNHGDEETVRKHHFHHHRHDSDSDVDEVEELARRLSKEIMRRSFSRGGIRHHHHHRAEEGGVRKWFKGLLNMHMF